ncbi:MAG: CDP-alcohol phosphatidyltransferase family protein [Alphaproteobacteria bacterium]
MLDAPMRKLIDPPLDRLAAFVARTGISANALTVTGFVVGMAAVPALAFQEYMAALGLILVNRLFDGLDGAVARRNGLTDLGGFLDICLDFIFYAGVVFGMTLGRPADEGVYGAFLIWSFIGPIATFLAFAILAAKHDVSTDLRGQKSLYYLGGLAEGTETLIAFILFCLFPAWFPVVCVVYGIMCWITAGTRIAAAAAYFAKSKKTAGE